MSYSSSDAATRLTAVREAIDRCLQAEAYTVRGRERISAKLSTLLAAERDLQQEVTASSSGRMSTAGRYVRPT